MNASVESLPIGGAYLLSGVRQNDARGDFTRVLDLALLRDLAADPGASYVASAHNRLRGTVRGLHYQIPPHEEAKTVWCSAGAIFDVLVDLRRDQPTFGQWISIDLSVSNVKALHIPPGVAHGYQTVEDDTTVNYLISADHQPDSARVINWRDTSLAISWPLPVSEISERDAAAPGWAEQ